MKTDKHERRNSKADRHDRLDALLLKCREENQLESWNSFIEAVDVPRELAPALITGRTELLALMQPRELTKEQCAAMFAVIQVLIKTNVALKQHAEQTAHLVDVWANSFKQLASLGYDITQFANFRSFDGDEYED